MWGSLLMLASTNNKLKGFNYIFAILWVIYMFDDADLGNGLAFAIANTVVFALVFGLGKIIKGKYSNKIFSALSIIFWSILIDIVCYYVYPQFIIGGQGVLAYIGSGIMFNYKFVLVNILAMGIIDIIDMYVLKIKDKKMNMVNV